MIRGAPPRVIGKTVEVMGLHKSGREFPVELTLGSWRAQDRIFFSGIIRDVSERKKAEAALKEEKNKTEDLLKNILPLESIEELKTQGFVRAKHFPEASILFTDIVGFTKIAEQNGAEELVSGLNEMFGRFDRIVKRRGLEKIKTIGDAYMCAGGIPTPNKTHAIDCVLAAIQFIHYARSVENRLKCSIRVGIHSGPVMGGIVGEWKYTYDIWGDAVNVAARMESSGLANRINISESTYRLVRYFFECESRGQIAAKHKGELKMYKIRRIKKDFSVDGLGLIPNELFFNKYQALRGHASH